MTALTALARARAVELGRAVPIATRRQVHLSDRPLVIVALQLAGEANAPLACLVGTSVEAARLLVVAQPRNRTLRFQFAAALAELVLDYVDGCEANAEPDGKDRWVPTDAPQVIVPNPGGVEFLRLLGRSTRLRRTTGEWAVPAQVPLLGRWLTHLAQRAEHAGSSMMLPLTSVLARHWATGQSDLEDANLAALMGWIDPWDGLTGPRAAAQAEDPVRWPPAGPATDPTFDNEVLAKLIRAYDLADSEEAAGRAEASLAGALRGQLEPTWRLVWRGVDQLRALPPGDSVAARWLDDRRDFFRQLEYWRGGGAPQGRVDQAVAAARRLNQLERELDSYAVDLTFDDPLAMAELRLTGEAFAGRVVRAEPTRLDTSGPRRKLRPHIVVATADPVRLEAGVSVKATTRAGQSATIVDIQRVAEWAEVTIELSSGMGRSLTPEPGSVPTVEEQLCYTSVVKDAGFAAPWPAREDTPWTHGGPPADYVPSTEDATEEWS